jgi:hypothetical protein
MGLVGGSQPMIVGLGAKKGLKRKPLSPTWKMVNYRDVLSKRCWMASQ